MSEILLHIDVSRLNIEARKNDLIKIKLGEENFIEVNYSKLVNLSKYILDKYKYSEACLMLQSEFDELSKKNQIEMESIKLFIQLIQDEKVSIPIKHYMNIYTLSEYFNIPTFIIELDNISQQQLFHDLNFTIEFYQKCQTRENNNQGSKMMSNIENFLSTRINECFENDKFSEIPITTISRIIEKSDDENIDHNLLIDFIIKSIEKHFTFLRFVKLEKMSSEKIDEFLKFIEEQNENQREIYLQYLPFNLFFIKQMKTKNENVIKELKQIKEELEQTKINFERSEEELKQTKINFERSEEELKQTKINFERSEKELKQTKIEHEQTKEEIKQFKIKHLPSIVTVGGYDKYNQLGKKPNIKDAISPSIEYQLDPSLSYSVYGNQSVMITSEGSLKCIGDNKGGKIASSLEKKEIYDLTEFSIKDESGHQLDPVSLVCSFTGTLYMFSKIGDNGHHLVLCDKDINGGDPVFLDIGNHHPVALFGGYYHSAAICSEGEIIFINRGSVRNSPKTRIEAISLPDGEKASSVACCEDSVVVLSSKGRVFSSPVEKRSNILKFSEVDELKSKEIICVSGTCHHFFAVSKEGLVFGRGSNGDGKLGLGEGIEKSSSFTEISSLRAYKIRAAYAGGCHSLFETREGKILSCGYNHSGQLLLSSGPGENIYLPTETTITSDATFCIAGWCLSVVFVRSNPPPNTPNMRIQ